MSDIFKANYLPRHEEMREISYITIFLRREICFLQAVRTMEISIPSLVQRGGTSFLRHAQTRSKSFIPKVVMRDYYFNRILQARGISIPIFLQRRVI
jgi:hypothetical protein